MYESDRQKLDRQIAPNIPFSFLNDSDILDLYLLHVCMCVAQHQLPVCEVKVTRDLCLKPYECSEPANARKSTKEVYLNQLLRFELIGELLQQGRPIPNFLYQHFHDIFCLLHHSLSQLPWQHGWVSLSVASKGRQLSILVETKKKHAVRRVGNKAASTSSVR